MEFYQSLKNKLEQRNPVVYIVSGLPRSGTSMMMKMLEAGGIKPLTDNIRIPDQNNPKGYFESERVKHIDQDALWMAEAEGKAVKIISMLLFHLPAGYHYRIVFMKRNMDEVIASQGAMLAHLEANKDAMPATALAGKFKLHLKEIRTWLSRQPNIEVLTVDYNEMLKTPEQNVRDIIRFLDRGLDEKKMVAVIDPCLYHQRKGNLPG